MPSLVGSLLSRLYFGPAATESEYAVPVKRTAEGNRAIAETLAQGAPCMVTRLGSSELGCIAYYVRWRRGRRFKPGYPASLKRVMSVNAGFFPATDEAFDRFCERYLADLTSADILGVWFNRSEQRIVNEFTGRVHLVELDALFSMWYDPPWSVELGGKRVLVVHPFETSIRAQYRENRVRIFADPNVLPEFELSTLAPPQTIAGDTADYRSWFDALSHTCERISLRSFDVALIGAGAYGLPIAAFVKSQGRQAIHLGGSTQLLFGIKGRRWEVEYEDSIVPLFNEHWVRPLPEETPKGSVLVEGGCYW